MNFSFNKENGGEDFHFQHFLHGQTEFVYSSPCARREKEIETDLAVPWARGGALLPDSYSLVAATRGKYRRYLADSGGRIPCQAPYSIRVAFQCLNLL